MALTQVKTNAIADDAVTTDKLANAINTERTANTAKVSLEDNAVTLAKMAGGTDGQIITYDASGDPKAIGPGTAGQVLTSAGAGAEPAFATPAPGVGGAAGLDLNDSTALRLGTDNDLSFYHDGGVGRLYNTTGSIVIRSDDYYFKDSTGNDDIAKFIEDGACELYHNNSKKLETTSTGATVTGSVVADNTPGRNLIMNGAMAINQRVSTAGLSDFNPVTNSLYTLDRWRAGTGSSFDWDSARVKQVADSPDGFSNSLRVDIGNTETPGANQNALIYQKIEGSDLQGLAYGTSSAKTCTLSFWVRSNKTGTYCAQISQHDCGKYVLYEYSISSANTWEKKTITFSGNTSDVIANDNGIGLEIKFHLTSHSNDHVSATTSWTAKPSGGTGSTYLTTSNQVNLWDHADNVWYITGVQLEVGSAASNFEYISYGDELLRCQRYFQRVNGGLTGVGASSTSIRANYIPIVNFRASPTISGNAGVDFNNPGVNSPTQSSFDCGIQFTYNPNNVGITLGLGNYSNATQGYTYIQWSSATEYIDFDAEL